MLKYTAVANLDMKTMKKLAEKYGKSAVETMADKIYEESQANCPVDSGNLKASGYKVETKHGWDVGYTSPYAAFVDAMPQKWLSRTGHGGKTHFLTGAIMKYRWNRGVDGNEL
jgi:hypothetical protein